MTISLTEPRRTRAPLQPPPKPKLDGPTEGRHPNAVVWLAGRGHQSHDGGLHIDFPMAVACDQSRALHRAAAAAEVWNLMNRLPGDRFVSLPVRGDALDLVTRSFAAWLNDTAQTVVRAARIGLGRDSSTERASIEESLFENAATARDGRPLIPMHDRMYATCDEAGFHGRPDALLMPLTADGAPLEGQPEYAAGIGPASLNGGRTPRVSTVLAVAVHPRIALLRAAWMTKRRHGLPFLKSLARARLSIRAGLVYAKDAEAYRNVVHETARDPRDLAGIGGVPEPDMLDSMSLIDDTLVDPDGWAELKPADPGCDRHLCGELSVNTGGAEIELW